MRSLCHHHGYDPEAPVVVRVEEDWGSVLCFLLLLLVIHCHFLHGTIEGQKTLMVMAEEVVAE